MTPTLSAEEMERERESFEAYYVRTYDTELERNYHANHCVGYINDKANHRWMAWLHRAALARHPQPECGDHRDLLVVGVRISHDGFGSYLADPTMGLGSGTPGEVREPLCRLSDAQRQIADLKRLLAERDAEIAVLRRSEAHELAKLRARIAALVEAGNPLSNAAYNLAQHKGEALDAFACALLSKLRKRWDAAVTQPSGGKEKSDE